MAVAPAYAATPRIGFGSVSTANTNRDGTGTIVDVLTGGTSGTKVSEIVIQCTGDPADSTVTLYLHDGTSYRLFDEFDLGNPAAASTTVPGFRTSRTYDSLVLPSNTWKLAAAITVAPTSGAANVFAFGGDL